MTKSRFITNSNELTKPALLLSAAIGAHNLEEALTFPYYAEVMGEVQRWAGLPVATTSWNALQFALIIATLLPAAMMFWAGSGKATHAKAFVLCALAFLIFANALLPHIPASIFFAGYTPGILTAVLVNIPLCFWLFPKIRSTGLLSAKQFYFALLSGLIALPLAMASILTISNAIIS